MLWYSLEAPHRGASNEYPQHMFSLRNKKNIMWIPPLICSYASSRIWTEYLMSQRPECLTHGHPDAFKSRIQQGLTASLNPSNLCICPFWSMIFRQNPLALFSHWTLSTSDPWNWSTFPVLIFLNTTLLLCNFNLPGFWNKASQVHFSHADESYQIKIIGVPNFEFNP